MHSSTFAIATATLFSVATADGIFAITGTGTVGSPTTVSLTVQNGNVGDVPTCNGTSTVSSLPNSGIIPCVAGYALSWRWESINEAISATYSTPSSTFTYNVPNNGCTRNVCQFGFTDLFPGAVTESDLKEASI